MRSEAIAEEVIIRKLVLVLLFVVSVPCVLSAQTTSEHRTHGYFFIGPGGVSDGDAAVLQIGAGVDARIYKGLGANGELGYFGPTSSLDSGFGIFSANGSYHFANATKSGKLVPFVSGGYSLFFRSGTANAVNFGGGVNYWFKDRLGLRVEFRDHVLPEYSDVHYWGIRFGLSFR